MLIDKEKLLGDIEGNDFCSYGKKKESEGK